MLNSIGQGGGGLARTAIEAALKRQAEALQSMQERVADAKGQDGNADKVSFGQLVQKGVANVDAVNKEADALVLDVVKGEIDFHEVASKLKQAELSLGFALQVRNKFVEAYREIMRMNV